MNCRLASVKPRFVSTNSDVKKELFKPAEDRDNRNEKSQAIEAGSIVGTQDVPDPDGGIDPLRWHSRVSGQTDNPAGSWYRLGHL